MRWYHGRGIDDGRGAGYRAGQCGRPAGSGALQEVTISARYTHENLQTTPLAITAVSGAELESRAIPDVASLSVAVLNFDTHVGDGVQGPTPTISMRGVTAGGYSFARDP